jgi:hypothetical protein
MAGGLLSDKDLAAADAALLLPASSPTSALLPR